MISIGSISICLAIGTLVVPVLQSRGAAEPFAYVVITDGTVAVIDTATNTLVQCSTCPIPVGRLPIGVTVTPNGSRAYVTNTDDNTVSVHRYNHKSRRGQSDLRRRRPR